MSDIRAVWESDGLVVMPKLLPVDLVDAYVKVREPLGDAGWPTGTPYMQVPEMRALCLAQPLVKAMEQIVGEPVGLHLNLTGWVSTQRTWHQDLYLNPTIEGLDTRYLGVWMALDDINPMAGPFQFIPGSHSWPVLERQTVWDHLSETGHPDPPSDPDWPRRAEPFVTEHWNRVITEQGAHLKPFIASKGDVLIWDSKLVHRGSMPLDPGLQRRCLIAHYSGIYHRPDMAPPISEGAGHYFPF